MSGREVALITGASMGIGKELAKIFAADGRDLVLVARSEDKLRDLAQELEGAYGIRAHVVPADLTDPGAPAAICPRATATNFPGTAGNATSMVFKLGAAPADKVARHAYRSMMKGKVVAIEGLMNWLSAFSVRFGPRALVRKITRWLNKP